jgi:hypothetical protein
MYGSRTLSTLAALGLQVGAYSPGPSWSLLTWIHSTTSINSLLTWPLAALQRGDDLYR